MARTPDDPGVIEDAKKLIGRSVDLLTPVGVAGCLDFIIHQIDPLRFHVDLASNTVSRKGVVIRLQPNWAVLVWKLAQAHPYIVPIETLRQAVWGLRMAPADKQIQNLRVMVSQVRRHLETLNATIENKHGKGYRLELQ
jgi:DNA-binding response OmpR family regulator